MARIKITFPATFIATVTIPVRITDVNYGNHVGNDAFVAIIHEARVQWLQQHGFSEMDVDGVGLIMSDLAIEFKQETFYGDVFEIKIAVGEITKASFELYYQITANRKQSTVTVAHAKTGMVCFDYTTKKIASIPDRLIKIMTMQ